MRKIFVALLIQITLVSLMFWLTDHRQLTPLAFTAAMHRPTERKDAVLSWMAHEIGLFQHPDALQFAMDAMRLVSQKDVVEIVPVILTHLAFHADRYGLDIATASSVAVLAYQYSLNEADRRRLRRVRWTVRVVVIEEETPHHAPSLYEDEQNVHASSVNRHTLATLRSLHREFNPRRETNRQVFLTVLQWATGLDEADTLRVRVALRFIRDDPSEIGEFTLKSTLLAVVRCILAMPPDARHECQRVLVQELIAMSGQCSTGHAARLCSAVAVFRPSPPMDATDELYASLKRYVETQCRLYPDWMDAVLENRPDLRDKVNVAAAAVLREEKGKYPDTPMDELTSGMSRAVAKYLRPIA